VAGAVAILLGATLALRPYLFPDWATPAFVALGTGLVTLATWAVGIGEGDNEILYLMPVLYSFYFLSERQALMQLGLVAAAYGWLLAANVPAAMAAQRWLTTVGTLLVAGLLVRALNRRVEDLVQELDSSARLDPLTGALNRRGFDERLGIELSRARRTGEPLTVLTVDLDGLKAINDRHGHGAGDETLELAAAVMADSLRDLDVLARTGGDEFVVLLPGCDPSVGLEKAEALRAEVRARSKRESWPVTASIGVAGAPPFPLDPEALMNAADTALYRAKALGRDRVSLAGRAELRRALSAD
jgi:diguanylate cyclase (GGDEF)-like protein